MNDLPIDQHLPTTRRSGVRSVLIVDDSRAELHALGERLMQRSYQVVLCGSGAEALDLIAARGFDLILLDLAMGGMSGMTVLSELRGNRDSADLPVIVVSGSTDPAAPARALNGGADDYVAKPADPDLLEARMNRVIARARRLSELKRANATLDARIAQRAIDLGEARTQLAEACADRLRLIASLQKLSDRIDGVSV